MVRTFLLIWTLSLAVTSGTLPAQVHAADSRPNIVLILTDDQRWDTLGCSGHGLLKTPHIDQLAAEGTRFREAFVTTSICCISRASYFTGQYCRKHGVGDFHTPLKPDALANTFPALMKRAGYRTGCFGKWGIGGPEPRELFDVWGAWGGQGEFHQVWKPTGEKIHNSEYLARHAEQFLRDQPAEKPFCLTILFKSPHDPYEPDQRDTNLFRDARFAFPKSASPAHFESLPDFIRNSEGHTRALASHPTPQKYQDFVRNYLQCIAGVDRAVGRIRSVLDDLKLADNTLIVFASDNGFLLGEHGLSHKWLMYEESIRVPLIIRPPASSPRARSQTSDALVLNIDVAPTLLDYAGIEVPKPMDGHSLRRICEGQNIPNWRTDFFYEHHFHFNGKIPRTEGVRDAHWKYVTFFDVQPQYEQLFDLRHDRLEMQNLASDPASAGELSRLRKRYQDYVRELPPPVLSTPAPKK